MLLHVQVHARETIRPVGCQTGVDPDLFEIGRSTLKKHLRAFAAVDMNQQSGKPCRDQRIGRRLHHHRLFLHHTMEIGGALTSLDQVVRTLPFLGEGGELSP